MRRGIATTRALQSGQFVAVDFGHIVTLLSPFVFSHLSVFILSNLVALEIGKVAFRSLVLSDLVASDGLS
jgi:hypothetical protein